MSGETPVKRYIRNGSAFTLYHTSGNTLLDEEAVAFFARIEPGINKAIDDPSGWEERDAAYRKKNVGDVSAIGTGLEPVSLQLADCYAGPEIEVSGFPDHKHPDYSDFFSFPRGNGFTVLRGPGKRDKEIIGAHWGVSIFVDKTKGYSVFPAHDDSHLYVALLRFDPRLIEEFGEGCRLELLD